jgi:hypothetical protein
VLTQKVQLPIPHFSLPHPIDTAADLGGPDRVMSIPGCSTQKRILRLEDAKLIRSGLFTEGDGSSAPTLLYASA